METEAFDFEAVEEIQNLERVKKHYEGFLVRYITDGEKIAQLKNQKEEFLKTIEDIDLLIKDLEENKQC